MASEPEFETRPHGEAKRLCNDAYLNQILDEAEQEAVELCLRVATSDHEMRLVATVQANTIRSLRQKLKTLSEGKTKLPKRGSVA